MTRGDKTRIHTDTGKNFDTLDGCRGSKTASGLSGERQQPYKLPYRNHGSAGSVP